MGFNSCHGQNIFPHAEYNILQNKKNSQRGPMGCTTIPQSVIAPNMNSTIKRIHGMTKRVEKFNAQGRFRTL